MGFKRYLSKIVPNSIKFKILNELNSLRFKKEHINNKNHYKDVLKKIKEKYQRGEKILVGFYVVFDSVFSAKELFFLMQKNELFTVKIVIIPFMSKGEKYRDIQYLETKQFFISKYGANFVLDGFDINTGKIFDRSDLFDFIYCANPYDELTEKNFSISYLKNRNVLPFYLSYGYMPEKHSQRYIFPLKELSRFWRVYADTKENMVDYKKYQLIKGKNVVLSGYAKMDELVRYKKTESKKSIIIAPHHTVNNKLFNLSNFLEYYDFFLCLPDIFPKIKFIFRPHPLLFFNIVDSNIWSKEQVDKYIFDLEKKGIVYSKGGDYLELFANSDGIIHDCSSFLVEYLFVDKPCCYMLKSKNQISKTFSKLGKNCLSKYYKAYNKQDILSFIQNIVLEGEDKLKEKRKKYVDMNLKINYPNVSDFILKNIMEIFLCG